ncbi:MAG: TOBE domain-containing protein [Acidimicrobiales bacterium]
MAGRTLDVTDDDSGLDVGAAGTFMVRSPERMHVAELSDPDRWTVFATVTDAVFQGPVVRYELALPDGGGGGPRPGPPRRLPLPGDTVHASCGPTSLASCSPGAPPSPLATGGDDAD